MIFFWALWAFCAGILATLLYFFFDSVNTTPGGPPALFFRIALPVLGSLAILLPGSLWLVYNDYPGLAKFLLSLPDLLGAAYVLWLFLFMVFPGRRN